MFKRLKNYFQKNWQFVIATGIALIAIYLSYVFYLDSVSTREPIFLIDPNQAEILKSESVNKAPIRVLKPDGTEIHSNLYILRFYFWNRGKASIRRENILEPIKIVCSDSTAEIIQARVLAVSRSLTNFRLISTDSSSKNSFLIDFDILDTDDGATSQIIYQGSSESVFKLTGAIEGVQSMRSTHEIPLSLIIMEFIKNIFIGLAGLIAIILFFWLLFKVSNYIEKLFIILMESLFGQVGLRIGKVIVSIISILFIILITYIMFNWIASDIKPDLEKKVTEAYSVPVGILPK